MKFLFVASIIVAASAAQMRFHLEPKRTNFVLVEERSANGSPTVTVTFPDGYTDTLVLSRYYSNEEDRMAGAEECHYIGHLAKEQDACVAMTGCVGSEDVDLTILSIHAEKSSMFQWTKDGHVKIIESPFKNGNAKSEMLERKEDDGWEQDLDEMEEAALDAAETAIEEMCNGMKCENIQDSNLLQIRIGYDDGFLAKVGGTADKAEAYVRSTLPHVQAKYCHKSLGTKIYIQRIGDIKHYAGESLQATAGKLIEMWDTTMADLGTADLMLYMGYENDYYGTVGIAWGKTVCTHTSNDKYKASINEWRETHTEAGHVIAHEIGHNLGMDHDFTEEHKAAGCDGTGIMSYGDPIDKWSECSKKDLQAHYLTQKKNWCMELAPSACDGSDTPITTQAPPPPPTIAPKEKCDVSKLFGTTEISGNFIMTINNFGNEYVSDISCDHSICEPHTFEVVPNACVYICGSETCP